MSDKITYAIGNKFSISMTNKLVNFEFTCHSVEMVGITRQNMDLDYKGITIIASGSQAILDPVTFACFVSADFKEYIEVTNYLLKGVNTTTGNTLNLSEYPFDCSIIVMNNNYKKIFTQKLYNVQLIGCSAPALVSNSSEDYLVMSVQLQPEGVENIPL